MTSTLVGGSLLLISGCLGWPVRPEAPAVSIQQVQLAKLSLSEPEFDFQMLVENPNAFTLKITRLAFSVTVGGADIAHGATERAFSVPPRGSTTISVRVTGEIDGVLNQLYEISTGIRSDPGYVMRGTVRLTHWPVPLPFRVSGKLLT